MTTTIEIYTFHDKDFRVIPTARLETPTPQRAKFAKEWLEENKDSKDGYVANGEEIVLGNDVAIYMGASRYSLQLGAIKEVMSGRAPSTTGASGLSTGVYLIVNGKIPMQKRGPALAQCPHQWMINCAWMNSVFLKDAEGKQRTTDPKVIEEPIFYDVQNYAGMCLSRSFKLGPGDYTIENQPRSLVRPSCNVFPDPKIIPSSFHYGFEFAARSTLSEKEFLERQGIEEIAGKTERGQAKSTALVLVPIEDLEALLRNQPKLKRENPATYTSKDTTELILLDHMTGGFFDLFETLTSRKRPENLEAELRKGGIDIIQISGPGTYKL